MTRSVTWITVESARLGQKLDCTTGVLLRESPRSRASASPGWGAGGQRAPRYSRRAMRRFGEPVRPDRAYSARPGAYGVIRNGDDVLLTEQAEPIREFQLPGGGVDPGESLVRALHRECLEETGWSIRVDRRLGAYQRYAYMPEYDLWARKVAHVYLCRPVLRRSERGRTRCIARSGLLDRHRRPPGRQRRRPRLPARRRRMRRALLALLLLAPLALLGPGRLRQPFRRRMPRRRLAGHRLSRRRRRQRRRLCRQSRRGLRRDRSCARSSALARRPRRGARALLHAAERLRDRRARRADQRRLPRRRRQGARPRHGRRPPRLRDRHRGGPARSPRSPSSTPGSTSCSMARSAAPTAA